MNWGAEDKKSGPHAATATSSRAINALAARRRGAAALSVVVSPTATLSAFPSSAVAVVGDAVVVGGAVVVGDAVAAAVVVVCAAPGEVAHVAPL